MFSTLNITTTNGNRYSFIARSFSTRNGFAHECEVRGAVYNTARANYINRTWESYCFQTVYLCAIRDLIDWQTENVKRGWMRERGYKKLTAARKSDFEQYAKNDHKLNDLREVIQILKVCEGRDYNASAAA